MITVDRCRPERLIETLREANVCIWDVRRGASCVRFCTGRRGAGVVRRFCEQTHGCAMTQTPGGIFGVGHALQRRLPGVIAALLVLCAVLVALQMVWYVDVTAVPPAYQAQAQAIADAVLPRVPCLKSALDTDALRKALLLEIPDFSWAEASVRGVTLFLQAQRRTAAPQVLPHEGQGDLVAACDALIESVTVTSGTAYVQSGDTVRAGDVVIGGTAGREGYPRSVQAQGEVLARVWYTGDYTLPVSSFAQRTGSTDTARTLQIGPFMLGLSDFSEPYASFETEESCVFIPSPAMGPRLCVNTQRRYETQMPQRETILSNARQDALARTMTQLPEDAQVLDVSYAQDMSQDGVRTVCTVTARRQIAITQEEYVQ